jgi:RNA polymerase sigma factor (sigma-70 family)
MTPISRSESGGAVAEPEGALGRAELARFKSSLMYLARRRYRLSRDVAEDLVQASLLTFVEVRHRYANEAEHPQILVGIFRNKCREHIGHSVRTNRVLGRALPLHSETLVRSTRDSSGAGLLDDLVTKEQSHSILYALQNLRPQSREMFRLITEEGLSRKQLMERFGLNANTLDSRLHSYRLELKKLLDRGVKQA